MKVPLQLDIDKATYRRAMAVTLKVLQEQAGLSYNQTVERAALRPGALGKFLAGSALPSMETFVRLCAAFGVSVFGAMARVYQHCLAAQGTLNLGGSDASDRHELAAVQAFAGFPASATLFAHGCCHKGFGCRCAPQCDCRCAGCHLAPDEERLLFEAFGLTAMTATDLVPSC